MGPYANDILLSLTKSADTMRSNWKAQQMWSTWTEVFTNPNRKAGTEEYEKSFANTGWVLLKHHSVLLSEADLDIDVKCTKCGVQYVKVSWTQNGVDIDNANTIEVAGGSCVQGHSGLHRGTLSPKTEL